MNGGSFGLMDGPAGLAVGAGLEVGERKTSTTTIRFILAPN